MLWPPHRWSTFTNIEHPLHRTCIRKHDAEEVSEALAYGGEDRQQSTTYRKLDRNGRGHEHTFDGKLGLAVRDGEPHC